MDLWILPADVLALLTAWAPLLDTRTRPRLRLLFFGLLFAHGRRTVTAWLRAAGITAGFPLFYYFVARTGRISEWMAALLFQILRHRLGSQVPWLFALDDTPTARYGPHVQGAGLHHNPTPGPVDQRFVYGHVWVTLAWVLDHPRWGRIALPLLARLYIRQRDLDRLHKKHPWPFRTKLELASDLIRWLRERLGKDAGPVWLCADGAYAKSEVLRTAKEQDVVLFSRLRRDAALRSLPGSYGGRGRPRIYGAEHLSLAKRAGQRRGWETAEVVQYGQRRTKAFKTFLATWRPAGGVIRVVLVRESHGWMAFFCTDALVDAATIMEVMAARFSIEETFKDLKEVWGAGQQQVRDVWANVGCYHGCLWAYAIVEWWSWGRSHEDLVDRSACPWDDASRRPSHRDKRRALQRACVREEFSRWEGEAVIPEEIRERWEQWITARMG